MNYGIKKNELYHFGILGQKWGVRRFQNPDGSLTDEGKKRYLTDSSLTPKQQKIAKNITREDRKYFYCKDNNKEYSLSVLNDWESTEDGAAERNAFAKSIDKLQTELKKQGVSLSDKIVQNLYDDLQKYGYSEYSKDYLSKNIKVDGASFNYVDGNAQLREFWLSSSDKSFIFSNGFMSVEAYMDPKTGKISTSNHVTYDD